MNELAKFLYDNYALVVTIVIAFTLLFIAVTIKVFFFPVDIPTGTVAAYSTFFVLASLTMGFWKWRRGQSNGSNDDTE